MEKRSFFYDFVFGPDEKREKHLIFQRFFHPYISNERHYRGIVDMYVRIKPDRTFIVSSTGVGRDLKIKDYQDDPKDPMYFDYLRQ